jgi:hypothetical protein
VRGTDCECEREMANERERESGRANERGREGGSVWREGGMAKNSEAKA